MEPKFFANQFDFREWLDKNHEQEKELLVGFYKIASGKPSLTWSESVDQALCFGWIDGVRRSIDHESYSIRFTPRKTGSIWSLVNIRKMEEMIPQGIVKMAGLSAYEKKQSYKSGMYTHEIAEIQLSAEYESILRKNVSAWEFFMKQPPYYKKEMTKWVMSAKQKTTQFARLQKMILACAQNVIL